MDVLIVGGGIVGLTVARALLSRADLKLAILEKEPRLGVHASGRNSGVLHAGFYYSAESLKARLCSVGSRLMYEYAQEKGIPVRRTGKVVVVENKEGLPQVDILLERAKANGIRLEKIDLKQLHELEPEAVSFDCALHSPDTAVVDSIGVLESLSNDLEIAGVDILKNHTLRSVSVKEKVVLTDTKRIGFGQLINASGLHADRIAHMFGVGLNLSILPFKGLYKKLTSVAASRIRGSIYPVPDLRMPFLGVHLTKNINNEVYVGPTAIPAFGRENYSVFQGIEPLECLHIASGLVRMIASDSQGMRRLVKAEVSKYASQAFYQSVRKLAPGIRQEDILECDKVGLRAQLYNKTTNKLEMDFVIENGPNSLHILNAISPAFSSSFAFADMVSQRIT